MNPVHKSWLFESLVIGRIGSVGSNGFPQLIRVVDLIYTRPCLAWPGQQEERSPLLKRTLALREASLSLFLLLRAFHLSPIHYHSPHSFKVL